MRYFSWTILLVVCSLAWGFNNSIVKKDQSSSPKNVFGSPARTVLNINNWSDWIQYDGLSGYNPILSVAGGIYPRGTANVIFQDGFIWGGYSHDGQVKIKREGLLIISPNGEYFMNGDKVYFAVDENTDMIEEFTVWIWTGSNWQKTVEETVTDTWNNGLSFSLEDAEISGSVVEVSNENGTARWTLILVPKIVQ